MRPTGKFASAIRSLSQSWAGFARRNPFSYLTIAVSASTLSIFAVAEFALLTEEVVWRVMAVCALVTLLGVGGVLFRPDFSRTGEAHRFLQHRQHADALLNTMDDGILLFDMEGRLMLVSGRFRKLFPEISERVRPGLLSDDLLRIMAAYGGRSEDGLRGPEFEGAMRKGLFQDGGQQLLCFRERVWVRLNAQILPDGGALVAVTDLTETINHRLKLRDSERKFERLTDRLPGALFQLKELADGQPVFSYWSSGAEDLLGIKPESLTGDPQALLDAVHPDDREVVSARLLRAQRLPAPWHHEFRLLRKDGTAVWVSISVRYSLSAAGRSVADGLLQDITALKDAEFRAVAARVAAEQADQIKSNFLAHMSHELRTPLNAIIGYSEVVSKQMFGRIENDRYLEYAGDIHFSGKHLLSLINDILDISRIQATGLDLFEEEVTLVELLDETRRLVSERASRKQQTIVIEPVDPGIALNADHRRLLQAMSNLLGNAVKFSPEDTRIDVSFRQEGHTLQLIVHDRGPGMSAEDIRQSMIPFNRANSMVAQSAEGSGLGLPLSKLLLEAHGGDLRIESVEGKGTKAIAELPVSRLISRSAHEAGLDAA